MKQKAGILALVPIIYFAVSGGPYGLEEIVSAVGPFYTLLAILIVPLVWSIPEYMIVAELASRYPVQGGYYRWVQMGMGNFWGFMEGWWRILYILIDLSLYPILFTTYLHILFPSLDFWSLYIVQLIMIWTCVALNVLGIRLVGNVLSVAKVFIVSIFVIFVIFGAKHLSFNFLSALTVPKQVTIDSLVFGVFLAFWNYIGLDGGSTILGEVEKPEKNYSKALLITIPIIALMYFFPILVGVCIHPDWQTWRFGEYSNIAQTMNLPILGFILSIGGMVTCFGLFNSLILTSTRVMSVMSEDRWLPATFSKIHKEYNTPYVAIIFSGAIYSMLVLVGFHKLVLYDVFLFLLAMVVEAYSLVALRNKNREEKKNFIIPFGIYGIYFFVAIATIVMLLMSLLYFKSESVIEICLFISLIFLSGLPIYFYSTSKNKQPAMEIVLDED